MTVQRRISKSHPKSKPKVRPTARGKARTQQDGIWKELLDELFEQFMALSFPDYYQDIDWSRGYVSMDKEMVEISQQSGFSSHAADKLFKVFLLNGQEELLLMHVEVQGYKDADFAHRVYDYNDLLGRRYNLEVVSMAVLTDADPDYRPNLWIRERRRQRLVFEFPIVKLLDYEKHLDELAESSNPFALIVIAQLKALRLRKKPLELKEAKFGIIRAMIANGYDRPFMLRLFQFIDGLTRLPDALELELRERTRPLMEETTMAYVSSWERLAKEEGRQEGLQEGRQEGVLNFVLMLMEQRFGSIEPDLRQRLSLLNEVQLQELGKLLLNPLNQADLSAWLNQHS